MDGVKVVAMTDRSGPLIGGMILFSPNFEDYRSICKNVLNGVGYHNDSNGWDDYGKFLSPFCKQESP